MTMRFVVIKREVKISEQGNDMTGHDNIPLHMKAMVLVGHGGLDKLVWHDDWPTPTPGAGEVLIRVKACGLNNTDINTRTSWYSKIVTDGMTQEGGVDGFDDAAGNSDSWSSQAIEFPRIQGADATGFIVAVGDGVSSTRIGQRVIVDPWIFTASDWQKVDHSMYFGSECDGGFAEFTTIPSENAVTIESDLSDAELATFSCALTTAENLVAKTHLQPGETVVIAGASGGVGSFATQLCRLRGARVIGIAAAAKHDQVMACGADMMIDRNVDNLSEAIREFSPDGIHVALDVVGGHVTPHLMDCLKQYGRYSTSGAISGPMINFDMRHLIYKDLQMTGATIVPPGTMSRLVRLIEQRHVMPNLAQSFPLKDLHQAQEAFMQKSHMGNIVVTCED